MSFSGVSSRRSLSIFVLTWTIMLFISVAHAASQTRSTSSCTNSGSGTDWTNTGNANSSNNSYATVELDDWDDSEYLQCTSFGFSIPSPAVINGIVVSIERKASNASSLRDNSTMIVKGGSRTGNDKADTSTFYPTSDTIATYGGASDTWGAVWTTDDINGSGFGAGLSVVKDTDSGGNRTASVDHVEITVYYTEAPPGVLSINRAGFNPATANSTVTWSVVFNASMTGVDAADFALAQSGSVTGASITSVTGSGSTWTVTANTGTGASGSLQLNLIDNDTILAAGVALGGAGAGNGNFSGQAYTIEPNYCSTVPSAIFCDDFERSNAGSIGNGWTVSPANTNSSCNGATGNIGCAGIDRDVPPFNDYSKPHATTTRSMFTRWATMTADSPTVNLAGRPAALVSFWMRRGSDTFSECPEAATENYLVQYWDGSGWKTLAQYRSSPSAALCGDGEVFTPTIQLPPDALHANFKLRFSQPSGSGDSGSGGASGVVGYDYWHMDNVVIVEAPASSYTGAFCDNFEGGLGRWSLTAEDAPSGSSIGDARLGSTDYLSAGHELDFRWGYVVASTLRTDMSGVSGDIAYWVKSGGGSSNRAPDSGEDLVAEYYNSSGTWTQLARYYANGSTTSTSYNASFPLPSDAKHPGFRLRFRQMAGSGYDMDYWHIDDVCVGTAIPTADLALTKTRGSAALVPGSTVTYTLTATNNGPDAISGGTLEIADTLPATLTLVSATGTGWNCSANGQTVTCSRVGSLAVGASAPSVTLTASLSVSATGSLTNTATLSGTVIDNTAANNSATNTGNIVTATLIARYHLEEAGWNGTAGEVKDDAGYVGGPYNGAALASSSPLPALGMGSPALTGSPGTCGYAALPGPAANGGTVSISGLPVSTTNGAKTSVAFWMYWDGTDNVMPLGWGKHDLWFRNNFFGFNTANSDIYGIASTGLANGWHHVVAVFTNGSVSANQLFIDGVAQTLTQRQGTPNLTNAVVGSSLRLGGWTNDTSYRFSGRLDEVLVYKDALVAADVADIYAATHTCAAAVDHYELSLPTNSINCLTTTATVTACSDSSSPCASPSLVVSGQTAKLTATGGTLGSTTVIFDALGVASTALSYPTAADGTAVTVTLSDEQLAGQNPRKCCPNGTSCVVANSCSTTFNTAGFIFSTTANGGAATIPAQVAGTSSGTYYLRAVKTNDNSAHTCGGALKDAQTVDMAYECNNPAACYASNLISVNGGSATTITRNDNGATPYGYTAVNFTFDANGNAPFTFAYSDVGQVTLKAKKTLTAAGAVAAATLTGTSNAFVVKPAGFVLSDIKQTASPNLANPGAANASGAKFVKAGENFSATVTAVTSTGSTAFSYGRETSPEGVKLTSALVTGLGLANNPNLSNNTAFGAFTNGVATGTTFAWNEVGIITLTPSVDDGNYLAAGDVTGTTSGSVGRFYPDHFVLSTSSVTPANATFSYMNQPFNVAFMLTAVASGGDTTTNYVTNSDSAKNFAKLAPTNTALWPASTLGATGFGIGAKNGVLDLSDRLSLSGVPTETWISGTTSIATSLKLSRPSTISGDATWGPYEALEIGIAPQDSDGAKLAPAMLDLDATSPLGAERQKLSASTTMQRLGRLRLLNTYGSELLEPRVEYRAEYWNGSRWTTNAADSTTTLVAANVFSTAATPTLKSITGLTNGVGFLTYNIPTGAGFFDIAFNLNASGNDTSCNASHGGTAANMPWLQAYWGAPTSCGSVAAWAQDPNARVKLGSPKAPYIYLRERY